MYDLETIAEQIKTILDAVPGLKTVGFIDKDDDSLRQPVTLPAAFVALEKVLDGKESYRTGKVEITWLIIIRSKRMLGTSGCLKLVDLAADTLSGKKTSTNSEKIKILETGFYDKKGGSIAYAIKISVKNMLSAENNCLKINA